MKTRLLLDSQHLDSILHKRPEVSCYSILFFYFQIDNSFSDGNSQPFLLLLLNSILDVFNHIDNKCLLYILEVTGSMIII